MPAPLASYHMLMKSRLFRAALDWLTCIGPGMFLLYGCTGCQIVPLLACGWYLCNVEWDEENDDYKNRSKAGQCWLCANCLLDDHSSHRVIRVLILVKAVWGVNYYFYFGGDRAQGVKEQDVMDDPEKCPLEVADMLFDMIKGMVLCKYIRDRAGRRARVTPDVLKSVLTEIMNDFAAELKTSLDSKDLVTIEANRGVTYQIGSWKSLNLGFAANSKIH